MAKLMNTRILSSTTVSASGNTGDIASLSALGGHIIVKTSNLQGVGSPAVVINVEGKDTQTGEYYTILQSASITSATTTVLKVFPGFSAVTNVAVNDFLPSTWRISYTFSGSDSLDLEIGANLIG